MPEMIVADCPFDRPQAKANQQIGKPSNDQRREYMTQIVFINYTCKSHVKMEIMP